MRNETSRIDQEAWKFADKTLMPHGLGLLIRLGLFIVAIGVAGIGRVRDAIARCRSDSLTAALASIRSPPWVAGPPSVIIGGIDPAGSLAPHECPRAELFGASARTRGKP